MKMMNVYLVEVNIKKVVLNISIKKELQYCNSFFVVIEYYIHLEENRLYSALNFVKFFSNVVTKSLCSD